MEDQEFGLLEVLVFVVIVAVRWVERKHGHRTHMRVGGDDGVLRQYVW